MFYPEGSLSPIGFICLFFIAACLTQFIRGLVAGLSGNPDYYKKKIGWFSFFLGLFLLYLIWNWQDIAANTKRGYESGVKAEREELLQFYRDLQKLTK